MNECQSNAPSNHSESSNGTECNEADEAAYLFVAPFLLFILLVAVICNVLILISAKWLRTTRVSPNLRLCVSLAGADAWTALWMMVNLLLNSVLELGKSRPLMCLFVVLETLRLSAMLTSNLHLLAISCNHCFSIASPLRYKVNVTKKRVNIVILLMWVVPSSSLMTAVVSIPNDAFHSPSCIPKFYFALPFRLGILLLFGIPVLATFLIYTHVLFSLFKARRDFPSIRYRQNPQQNQLNQSNHNSVSRRESTSRRSSGCSRANSRQNSMMRNQRLRQKTKTITTTLMILGSFAFAWFPALLWFVLFCQKGCHFDPNHPSLNIQNRLIIGTIINLLLVFKFLVNPLIYTVRITNIRLAFWLMWKSRFGCRKVPSYSIPGRFQSVCYSAAPTPSMCLQQHNSSQGSSLLSPNLSVRGAQNRKYSCNLDERKRPVRGRVDRKSLVTSPRSGRVLS